MDPAAGVAGPAAARGGHPADPIEDSDEEGAAAPPQAIARALRPPAAPTASRCCASYLYIKMPYEFAAALLFLLEDN